MSEPENGAPSPGGWRQPPPWKRALMLGGVLAVMAVAFQPGLLGQLWRGGLRPCRNLDERLCRDLGPQSCDVWKNQLGGSMAGSSQPHEWRRNKTAVVDVAVHKLLGWNASREDNPLCYDQLDDAVYPQILAGIRAAVGARGSAP
jgi:hypothetical protein